MTADSGNKPGAAGPVDYTKRRHQPEKTENQLNAAGQALLTSIDEESARPRELTASYPRIVNHMAKIWRIPREMDRYFDELLTDARGGRQGFPLRILMELGALKDYYHAKLFPTRRDPFDPFS
jgi:hypothetical protein